MTSFVLDIREVKRNKAGLSTSFAQSTGAGGLSSAGCPVRAVLPRRHVLGLRAREAGLTQPEGIRGGFSREEAPETLSPWAEQKLDRSGRW